MIENLGHVAAFVLGCFIGVSLVGGFISYYRWIKDAFS